MTIQYRLKFPPACLLAATASVVLGGPALAQSTGSSTAIASDEPLEEVIVTAQKREERLLDTPISIGVLTGEALDKGIARDVTDALQQVAGVSMSKGAPGNSQIAIRGVLSGAGTSTTGYYLDEIPFSFVRNSPLPDANAYDLARIEVLRGPQGTLYGANALNGVIRVLTNDAQLDAWEVKGRARTSDTSGAGLNWATDLAANVPIVEGKLAVRGVVSYEELSGFINSTLDGGRDINDSSALSYRFKATYQPFEQFNLKASASRSKYDFDAPTVSRDDGTTVFRSNQPGTRTTDLYNLLATYDGAAATVLSSTSYLKFKIHDIYSENGIPDLHADLSSESFSQEIRLSSNLEGPLQFSTGGFYREVTDKVMQDPTASNVFGLGGVLRSTDESEAYALFADATYSLFEDKIELTGGLRYYDETQAQSQQGSFYTDPPRPLISDREQSFDEITGRGVVTFKPRRNRMFYASYSTGFRSGMFQSPSTQQNRVELPRVRPDTLDNYEVGAKGSLFGDVLTYDSAVYYMDWQGVQQALRLPPPVSTGVRLNAGSASGWGAEGALTLRASNALSFNVAAGWNDLTIDEDVVSFVNAANPAVVLFAKDSRLNESPEWTGSAGGTFRAFSGIDAVDFVASSNVSYTSVRKVRFLSGAILTETKSGEITNLSASFGLEAERWSVTLYGDNLLDDFDPVTAPDLGTFLGNAARLRPRTIGLQTTFSF